MLLSELTSSAERVALVGLAKNTGKTVALGALLAELAAAGRRVAVTSVGRDGEEHDVIDSRIEKPAVELVTGSIVASTDSLLRASGVPLETLVRTGVRTPLGEVLIARLGGPGAIEIAGPSGAEAVRDVAEQMLALGAEQVLIDGAVDRRAASSPDVADVLVMSTGAVLSEDIDDVIARTRDAVALVRLPIVAPDTPAGARALQLASGGRARRTVLLDVDGSSTELPARFVLSADAAAVGRLLAEHPRAERLIVEGALPEAFVREVALAARRRGRALTLVVADPTRVFLSERGSDFYRDLGAPIETLRAIDLRALTVNPQAPRSHEFDSAELRARLADAIAGVPIFDVMHPDYRGALHAGAARERQRPSA